MDYRVCIEYLHQHLRVKEEVDGKIFRVRIVKFAEAVVERRFCEQLHSELKKHELLEKNLVMELLDLQGQLNEKKKSSNSVKKMSTHVPTINFELPPFTSSNKCEKKLSFKEKLMKIAEFSKIDMFPSINKPPPVPIQHVAEKLQTAPAEKPIKQIESPVIRAAKQEDTQRPSRGNKIKIIDVSTVKPQQASQEPKPAKHPIPEKYLKSVRKISEKKTLRNPSMCSVTMEDLNLSQCSHASSTGPPTSREDIRTFISNIKSMKSGGKMQMSDEKKPLKNCLQLSQEKNEITVASQNESEAVVQVKNVPAPLSDAGDVKISESKEEAGKSKTKDVKIKSDTMNDKLESLFARKRPAEAEICLNLKTLAVQSEVKNMPPPPKSVRFADNGESTYKSADQISTFQSKSSESSFASTYHLESLDTAEADTSNYSPHFDHAGFSPERPFSTSPPSNFMFGTDSEADNEEAGGKFLFGGSATRSGFSLFPNP